jgi:hypothetical protein
MFFEKRLPAKKAGNLTGNAGRCPSVDTYRENPEFPQGPGQFRS